MLRSMLSKSAVFVSFCGECLLAAETLAGAGEDCFRGLFYEVSLALVGVPSPA